MDDSGISRQVNGTLGVQEDAQSFLVVINEDAEDWLVRFEKAPDFEAQGWAEHMANTYNDRLMSDADDEFFRVTARSPDLHASLDYR